MSIISISPYQWPCNRNLTWRYLPYWSGHVRPIFQAYIPTIHMVPKKYGTCTYQKNYPLVNVYITMENHHFQWVNPLFRLGHGFKFAKCQSLPEGRIQPIPSPSPHILPLIWSSSVMDSIPASCRASPLGDKFIPTGRIWRNDAQRSGAQPMNMWYPRTMDVFSYLPSGYVT